MFNVNPGMRWGINGIILLGMVVALYLGQTIFIPTILALLLAAMLWPAATWLNVRGVPFVDVILVRRFPWFRPCFRRLKLPWGLSCMIVVGGLVALAMVITFGFGLAITKMLQDLPTTESDQIRVYTDFRAKIQRISPWPLDTEYLPVKAEDSKVFQSIKRLFDPDQPYIIGFLKGVASYAGSWIWQWILIMFILLFLMVEGRMLSRRVVEIFGPSSEAQTKAVRALADMAVQVRTYLVYRTLINFGMALGLGLIYYSFGLKQSWTWALLTSILWYVPYLGPIAAGVPPILDAFVTCDNGLVAIYLLIIYTIVVIIEGYVIVPVLMGHSMELNATTVMLACMFWELVWGLSGLFLAMPLMAALKAVCYHIPDWRPWANLMSTRDDVPHEDDSSVRMTEALLGRDETRESKLTPGPQRREEKEKVTSDE